MRKRRNPKQSYTTRIAIALNLVMPVKEVLEGILKDGTVDVTVQGNDPVYHDTAINQHMEIIPMIAGFMAFFENVMGGLEMPHLQRLKNQLSVDMPLQRKHVEEALNELSEAQKRLVRMDVNKASQYIQKKMKELNDE